MRGYFLYINRACEKTRIHFFTGSVPLRLHEYLMSFCEAVSGLFKGWGSPLVGMGLSSLRTLRRMMSMSDCPHSPFIINHAFSVNTAISGGQPSRKGNQLPLPEWT